MKFQIGDSPGIKITLPVTEDRDGLIYKGKVKIDIYCLKCSVEAKFTGSELKAFRENVSNIYETLKGEVVLQSIGSEVRINIAASLTGGIVVSCKLEKSQFTLPYDSNWSAQGKYTFEPNKLIKTIEAMGSKN